MASRAALTARQVAATVTHRVTGRAVAVSTTASRLAGRAASVPARIVTTGVVYLHAPALVASLKASTLRYIIMPIAGSAKTAYTTLSTLRLTASSAAATKQGGVTISSLSVDHAESGEQITITGTGFGSTQGTSTVKFGTTEATCTAWSATSITAIVPVLSPNTYYVTVTVGAVTSNQAYFYIPGTVLLSALSVSHAAIGAQVTITGSGFGASRGTSTVWFGELPQYTFADSVVARPCTKEAASYVSWSDTQVVVTVPSMSPGLSGVPGTYHPVYVEVGGADSNCADFYIDPVTTLDANSSTAAWQTVFPNSAVTKTTNVYTNSAGSRHSSYTTYVTLDASSGPMGTQWGNLVHQGSHDVLIKDCTFTTSAGVRPDDSGVITMGSYATGETPVDIYNITFYNCVVANNLQNRTGWSGVNGMKVYHGGPGHMSDWTWCDCSFGTPNSPNGAFSRFTVEFVEYNVGFASYSYSPPNFLSFINFNGCDFEPPDLLPLSFACGGRGPDRYYLIDDCLFKAGNAFEMHLHGVTARNCDIWSMPSDAFRMEGNSSEFGGEAYIGPYSHVLFKHVDIDCTQRYSTLSRYAMTWGTTRILTEGEYGGIVFDDCDINTGAAGEYPDGTKRAVFSFGDPGWDNLDMSTSYIHGSTTWCEAYHGAPSSAYDYFMAGSITTPELVQAEMTAHNVSPPNFGTRP